MPKRRPTQDPLFVFSPGSCQLLKRQPEHGYVEHWGVSLCWALTPQGIILATNVCTSAVKKAIIDCAASQANSPYIA